MNKGDIALVKSALASAGHAGQLADTLLNRLGNAHEALLDVRNTLMQSDKNDLEDLQDARTDALSLLNKALGLKEEE